MQAGGLSFCHARRTPLPAIDPAALRAGSAGRLGVQSPEHLHHLRVGGSRRATGDSDGTVRGERWRRCLARCSLPLDDVCYRIGRADCRRADRSPSARRDSPRSEARQHHADESLVLKALDFGLAKMERPVTGSSPEGETVTEKGAIVGTLHYMSPEQVEGKEADARSGMTPSALCSMKWLPRKPAFEASSRASAIAAILEREPAAFEPMWLIGWCARAWPRTGRAIETARDLKRALEWSASGSGARRPRAAHFPEPAAALAELGCGRRPNPGPRDTFFHPLSRKDLCSRRVDSLPDPAAGWRRPGTLISMSPTAAKLGFHLRRPAVGSLHRDGRVA